MSRRVPDLLVEKLHLGELSPSEAARVRAQLEADGELARLTALEYSDRELSLRLPPLALKEPAPARTRRWLAPALVFASAGLLIALAWPLIPSGAAPLDTLRAKGGPQLIVHRLGAAGPELMAHGQSAREGDRLQLSARLPTPMHLAILSVDGLGVVTVHQPPTDTPVLELQVDSSFVLDPAPHYERFFLFVSAAPMAPATLVEALERIGRSREPDRAPTLPDTILVHELRLDKPDPK